MNPANKQEIVTNFKAMEDTSTQLFVHLDNMVLQNNA